MAKRKNLIAGNWKMNNTIGEAVVLAQEISNEFEKEWAEDVDVCVCPPFVDLKAVREVFRFDRRPIAVGAQNVYYEPKGAFTGEVSVAMLAEIGCEYCIVGHSERREYFGETNEAVNLKAKALIAGHVKPIVCVGESLAVRDEGIYLDYVNAQVRAAFAGIAPEEAADAVVAYEPIWAIGTGRT
ncbi:MAG: triose-phosphate isomerase, partial [Eggerthellaceae bacterium]|nr:triose-phosphate isomerase [Eggerthellaceae bacterium]